MKLLAVALLLAISILASGAQAGSYRYTYVLDGDGGADVTIVFTSTQPGSTWLLVPRGFTTWSLKPARGEVFNESLSEAAPIKFTFYQNLSFSYSPLDGGVEVAIEYRAPYAALIEEPRGFFYSTQVSVSQLDDVRLEVKLPPGSGGDVKVYGAASYEVGGADGRAWVRAEGPIEGGRLIVEFALPSRQARLIELRGGRFKVEAPSRYEAVARRVLELYVKLYPLLRDVFNVELEEVDVRLYVPSVEDVARGVGGFIPFTGGKLGDVNLNLFYVRAAEGTLEHIALHELIHHFLWRAGIQPSLLWVHEGLAEYLSIELGKKVGLSGPAGSREQALSSVASQLRSLGFIEGWSFNQPGDLTPYYAASYAVFKRLADSYGGLSLYSAFFNYTRARAPVDDEGEVLECLSLAAGADLRPVLAEWGFKAAGDRLTVELASIKEGLAQLPNWCQPAKLIARLAMEAAGMLAGAGLRDEALAATKVAKGLVANGEVVSLLIYATLAATLALSAARLKQPKPSRAA